MGEAAAIVGFIVILAGSIAVAIGAHERMIRNVALGLAVLFIASGAWIGFQVFQIVQALTGTEGPAEAADPTALASAQAKLDGADDDGGFRIELTETEIQAVIQDGLASDDSPLRSVSVDIVPTANGDQGRMFFVGSFKRGSMEATGSVRARLDAGSVQVEVVDVGMGSMNLPGIGRDAVEDIIESIADLNTTLARQRADVQDIHFTETSVIIVGTQSDGQVLTSGDLLGGIRDQASQLAGATQPPPERLGPGVVNSATADGSVYYVALGDSLAANVGVSEPRDGYVSRFHRFLQDRDGASYGLRNFGISGETTGSMIRGGQLDAAIDFLETHDVRYVTIDIGANDLLGHLGSDDCLSAFTAPACQDRIESAMAGYERNIVVILDRLSAAAPNATIVFLRAYNPFSFGFGGAVEFEAQSDATLDRLNDIAAAAATERGILVADGFTPMQGTASVTTRMTEEPPDIHPLPIGFDVLASALADAVGG